MKLLVVRVTALVRSHTTRNFFTPGRFWWRRSSFTAQDSNLSRFLSRFLSHASRVPSTVFLLHTYVANFTSTITYTDEQIASAPPLEPAFEHLRNSTTQSVISTLRVNGVTDRETFDKMFDSETALKEGASDLGFNLTSGGLPLKREFARVVTAWKTAKIHGGDKVTNQRGRTSSWCPSYPTSLRLDFDPHGVQEEVLFTHCRRPSTRPVDVRTLHGETG